MAKSKSETELFSLVVQMLCGIREDVGALRRALAEPKSVRFARMANPKVKKASVKAVRTRRYFSVEQIAKKIRMSTFTVYNDVKLGRLEVIDMETRPWKITREAAESYIEMRSKPSTSAPRASKAKKQKPDLRGWVGVAEAAKLIGFSSDTAIYGFMSHIGKDKIRKMKVGNKAYYNLQDLQPYRNTRGGAVVAQRRESSAADRHRLGVIMSTARKARRHTISELAEMLPTEGEPYIDYTGRVRNSKRNNSVVAKINTISLIERGKLWPSALQFRQLVEALEIPKAAVEDMMCLLPIKLLQSMEHLGIDPLRNYNTTTPATEPEPQVTESEVREVEAALEKMGEPMFPESHNNRVVNRVQPLRIAVVGSHGKNWARHAEEGWGVHTVDFLDTDRMREIRGQYDLLVEAGASHKATQHLQSQNGWNLPIAKFDSGKRVNTPRALRNWLALYEHGAVSL